MEEGPPGRAAEPQFPVDLTVKVRAQLDGVNQGEVSALSIRNIDGREDPVDGLDALRRELARLRDGQLSNSDTVHVEADPSLRVRSLARVMDVCRQAGFRNV